jgi:hypothetical protein
VFLAERVHTVAVTSPTRTPGKHAPLGLRGWLLIGGGLAAGLVIVGLAGLTLVAGPSTSPSRQGSDAKLAGCTADRSSSLSTMEATVEVTNSGNGSADYLISVAFTDESGGRQYDTASAMVRDLEPGQTGSQKAVALTTGYVPMTFTCKILRVTRL